MSDQLIPEIDTEAFSPCDFNDLSDVPDCEQYIQALLNCGIPWWKEQNGSSHLIIEMCKKMHDDGRSSAYIAKVSIIAQKRMFAYKEQIGAPDII